MKKILLVDGNSMLFRAYYGTAYSGEMLRALDGTPTNAVFAFVNILMRQYKAEEYQTMVVCFDKGKQTFRHEMMKDYKGGRSKTPEELVAQFPIVREYLSCANVPFIEMDNFEADDLIGCLAQRAKNDGFMVDILSSDKDMFQLIDKQVRVITKQGTDVNDVMDLEKLQLKWQVAPDQVPDLKGLMGDPSDNLKGIPMVGEKTAIKWIGKYHDIENLFAHVDELPATFATRLRDHIEDARLCKKIATIIVDLPLSEIDFAPLNLNYSQMIDFYHKYNMNSLAERIDQSSNSLQANSILHGQTVQACTNEMFNDGDNAVFLELFDENYHTSMIIGWSWANKRGCFYQAFEDLRNDPVAIAFLASKSTRKIVYDLKKIICALARYDLKIEGIVFDLMLACYVFNPNVKNTLDTYVQLILHEQLASDELFYNRGSKKSLPADTKILTDFVASKAAHILDMQPKIAVLLEQAQQTYLYEKIEFPCAFALAQMELNGVRVDLVELDYQCQRVKHLVEELAEKLQSYADFSVNPNSPKQLKQLLYEKLQLFDGKNGSTAQDVLENIAHTHPIINILLDYRKYQKLYSVYLDGMKKFLFADGKVHTIYKQTLTNTGRLSSIEPNMQNISVHDPFQKEVRKIFVSDSDAYILMSCDYSQIELRVLAHMSQDQLMIDSFNNGEDIHTNTAMKVFHLQRDQIDDQWRRKAKAVNFGIIYGISDFGLSRDLNIGVKEAKGIIENYYQQFPTIKNYINKQVEFCQKNGYVETMFNRRRYVPEINDRNYVTREFGKRVAMNMPIQGTAADIIKLALNDIYSLFLQQNLKSKITAQVHDELIFEVHRDELTHVQNLVQNAMEKVLELRVVLKVDTKLGNNWYNIK